MIRFLETALKLLLGVVISVLIFHNILFWTFVLGAKAEEMADHERVESLRVVIIKDGEYIETRRLRW